MLYTLLQTFRPGKLPHTSLVQALKLCSSEESFNYFSLSMTSTSSQMRFPVRSDSNIPKTIIIGYTID